MNYQKEGQNRVLEWDRGSQYFPLGDVKGILGAGVNNILNCKIFIGLALDPEDFLTHVISENFEDETLDSRDGIFG